MELFFGAAHERLQQEMGKPLGLCVWFAFYNFCRISRIRRFESVDSEPHTRFAHQQSLPTWRQTSHVVAEARPVGFRRLLSSHQVFTLDGAARVLPSRDVLQDDITWHSAKEWKPGTDEYRNASDNEPLNKPA